MEVKIPSKHNKFKLQNNCGNPINWLKSTTKKVVEDEDLAKGYKNILNQDLEKECIHKVSSFKEYLTMYYLTQLPVICRDKTKTKQAED